MDGGLLYLHVGSHVVLSASLEGPLPVPIAYSANSLSVRQSRLAILQSGVSLTRCCYQFCQLVRHCFSTSTRRVPWSAGGAMCHLALRSLAVLALLKSCVGLGTGDSAPCPLLLAGFLMVVPAVSWLTVPHPALVSHLTSRRPIPSGGRPPPS